MKAIQIEAFGNPAEVVKVVDVPDVGAPAAGEVVIALEALPINPSDLFSSPAWTERIKTDAPWLRPLPPGDVKQFAMLGVNPPKPATWPAPAGASKRLSRKRTCLSIARLSTGGWPCASRVADVSFAA
jgi:hypothetical protein